MSLVNAPFGLNATYHPTGLERGKAYRIASGYATNIFKNQPVILNTNGTITAGAAAADLLGVFAGVEYVDLNGKPTYSPNWIAGTTVFAGTVPQAWVLDDPEIVYKVQADGVVAQTAIGDQCDLTNAAAGSALTGISAATVSATPAGAGVQGQFRIVGFDLDPANAIGDAFTVLQVKIARHQFIANKVAI
jgi:hypothetical protein